MCHAVYFRTIRCKGNRGRLWAILFHPCFGVEVFTVAILQTINKRRVADVTLWPINGLESANTAIQLLSRHFEPLP